MKTNLQLKNGIVMITATLSDGRVRYSTGIRLSEEVFNEGKFKAFKDLDKLKVSKLVTIQNEAIKALLSGFDTVRKFRAELDMISGRKPRSGLMLSDFATEWVADYRRHHNHNTYKSFETLIRHLKNNPIRLADVDDDYYNSINDYFYKSNFTKNFTAKMIINLRRILREAEHQGKWKGSLRNFKAGYEDVYNIYLKQEELDRIYTAELPKNQRNAADMFLLGCYTGLRYEDFIRLREEFMGEFLTIDTLKTKMRVSIPIHPVVHEILRRRPHPISNQKMNLYLKDVAENCKIEGVVIKRTTRGNVSVEERLPRKDMVKTHTARRTFCTLMYLNGVAPELIMKISGHKSIRQLLSYIKIDSEDTARLLSTNPFFNPSEPKI